VELSSSERIILYQNEPNPFGDNTIIRYFIPENTGLENDAYMVFYDEFGRELKKIKITDRGYGKIEVSTAKLADGIYTYSMIIGDKIIETKKMLRIK